MAWPTVQNEFWTLARAIAGRSLARFGDAELRLAMGPPAKPSKTQEHDVGIQAELLRMLHGKTVALVCLPRLNRLLPNYTRHWATFRKEAWQGMVTRTEMTGSSFITRPDSAPDIDRPAYWQTMRLLWKDKDIVLVIGEPDGNGKQFSLTRDDLHDAKSVSVILGPERHAYAQINVLDREIGTPQATVILCLGATATCLAERLASRGVQAYDLGHLGRFMRGPK